ncbi:conserved Plasmodium protein, unknown function [Plasmodium gaboni]|uniref:Uncharacterized protein n=1 Tax=Plasmodium gaboni TaxID=647221 RepID=A0ABY0KW42_9APIC|nr:conserved Plasmodium protein, unknown function [Plasmodium gaboni]
MCHTIRNFFYQSLEETIPVLPTSKIREIISSIKKILKENGILVINLLTRDIKARTYVYQLFKTLFVSVINISSSNKEINDVIVCSSEVITEERISTFHIGLMEMVFFVILLDEHVLGHMETMLIEAISKRITINGF